MFVEQPEQPDDPAGLFLSETSLFATESDDTLAALIRRDTPTISKADLDNARRLADEVRRRMKESSPGAFLSYTRLDDEFFGGAITSLRRLLELGVQVVTGDRSFSIFQDVDGIELGQKWQKRLDEAISDSMFLIPIVTPLFLTSEPCRDELEKFIEHEKNLGRDDLILPIYFQTSPLLEKPDERKEDRLASEIASRQMYDWRDEADLPLVDPKIRSAVRDLARSVATALARTVEMPVRNEEHTYIDEPYRRPAASAATAKEVTDLVRDLEAQNEPTQSHKVVLWVDDTPANNTIERQSMAAYNIDFVLATSTGQALAKLQGQRFGAIISDMGRPRDSQAGYTLLEAVRESGDQTPYFIYSSGRGARASQEAKSRGAQGITSRGDELIHMVINALDV